MADFAACTVPLSSVQKISVHLSSCKKTLAQIKTDTGADYLLNGTLYNTCTGAVNCHLKADGTVIARPDYTVYGYAWDTGPDIAMTVLPCGKRNYIACTPLIVSVKKLDRLTYDPGQGGRRGRTAIGIKQGRLALYCTRDGTGAARTPEALRDDLFTAGWDSAVMLDGGDSSQCDFAGQRVVSGRKVQHYLCIWLKKEENKPAKTAYELKRDRVLSIAAAEIGTKEDPAGSNRVKYGAWFGLNGYAWCMMFVQWVFARAGLPLPVHTASCTELANYARTHGQWVTSGYKPGDILFLHWNKSAAATEHTGIVEAIHATYVTTIEGNTSLTSQDNGGAVMRRNRAYANITGAYRPWYNL